MKVALVHDYLGEFGGAERVLEALCEIWPEAPIYTAFYRKDSAYDRFKDRKIITSWAQKVPFFTSYLHSPLRFLAPLIWNSFVRQLADYDVVISSASWYVTKGFKQKANGQKQKAIEICYCHTPPRYLYGYPTSIEWRKYWPVRIYALLVNHFMRVYDFEAAQRVDWFIANSKEVQSRIRKFYRRESVVIYPPVDVKRLSQLATGNWKTNSEKQKANGGYFLVVSRLVGAKNVDLAVKVCKNLKLPLKVVGVGRELDGLRRLADLLPRSDLGIRSDLGGLDLGGLDGRGENSVEFLGDVDDDQLVRLYQNCRAVIFPASQEDFGLVPVEAMAAGKPVIALSQGGVLETVIDGKTGVYFNEPKTGSLGMAINKFIELEKKGAFDPAYIKKHAQKFAKERFKREILKFVESKTR